MLGFMIIVDVLMLLLLLSLIYHLGPEEVYRSYSENFVSGGWD